MRKRVTRVFSPIAIIVFLAVILNGCMFGRLNDNLAEIDQYGLIRGIIQSQKDISGVIVVFLVADDPVQPVVKDYKVLKTPGEFFFNAKPGQYRIFAFDDADKDGKYQAEERVGRAAGIRVQDPVTELDKILITLPEQADPVLMAEIAAERDNIEIDLPDHKINLGKIVDLRDDYFSLEYASMGMWEPMRFAREVPFGLFFLGEYDPKKTPVLFVHGIAGTPMHFKDLIAGLDLNRFQPWIIYYPSGFRLKNIVSMAGSSIEELHSKYQFEKLAIVAHSMGGLVSRGVINNHNENHEDNFITLFVSISTPWGGHDAAAAGVKRAPAVVPVWRDMAPHSEYLATLFDHPLPDTLPHYLLFGFKNAGGIFGGKNDDGVVTISSQLRVEAQDGAEYIRGYDKTHVGILSSNAVLKRVNSILESWDKE